MPNYADFSATLPSECASEFGSIPNTMKYSIYALAAKSFIGYWGLLIPKKALWEYLDLTVSQLDFYYKCAIGEQGFTQEGYDGEWFVTKSYIE